MIIHSKARFDDGYRTHRYEDGGLYRHWRGEVIAKPEKEEEKEFFSEEEFKV